MGGWSQHDFTSSKEITVLSTNVKAFIIVLKVGFKQKREEREKYCTLQDQLLPFLAEVFALVDNVEKTSIDYVNRRDFITASTVRQQDSQTQPSKLRLTIFKIEQ